MPKFKFKSARKNKFNFIQENNEALHSEIIKGSHMEIFSNKRIIIEGCSNIIDYQEDYIKLKFKKSYLNIFGTCFIINYFDENKIDINGNIVSMEFCV